MLPSLPGNTLPAMNGHSWLAVTQCIRAVAGPVGCLGRPIGVSRRVSPVEISSANRSLMGPTSISPPVTRFFCLRTTAARITKLLARAVGGKGRNCQHPSAQSSGLTRH
jgi:hypothetical protein